MDTVLSCSEGKSVSNNALFDAEQAIIEQLGKYDSLTFTPLAQLIRVRRQLLGFALSRLLTSGVVVVKEQRWVVTEEGESQIPVYALAPDPAAAAESSNPEKGESHDSSV
jgi:hypothetical protein